MEKVPDSHHLIRRGSVWYYKRRVPEYARAAMGKTFIQFSLKTTKKPEAKKLREAWDLHWSARFESASQGLDKEPSGGSTLEAALNEPYAIRLVRDYVERLDRRFQDRQVADGPASAAQRAEIPADIEAGIEMLRKPDDPRGAERVSATRKKLLSDAEAKPGKGGLTDTAFGELVRRGLLEVDYRKLARLADDYSRRGLDPLFDPAAPPPVTFAELADQFLNVEIAEAEANGTSQKSIDRQRANVALLRQLVGDGTLVGNLDYDACQEVRRLLARVPTRACRHLEGSAAGGILIQAVSDLELTAAPLCSS